MDQWIYSSSKILVFWKYSKPIASFYDNLKDFTKLFYLVSPYALNLLQLTWNVLSISPAVLNGDSTFCAQTHVNKTTINKNIPHVFVYTTLLTNVILINNLKFVEFIQNSLNLQYVIIKRKRCVCSRLPMTECEDFGNF